MLPRKKVFLGYKNRKFKKSKKMTFFHFSHRFGPKMVNFSTFFLGNISQENIFYDNLARKNAFLGYKNKKFKKSKNFYFFLKGLNPWFCSKNGHFPNFFFFLQGNIGQENIFYVILAQKNAFLGYKNKKFKKVKKLTFLERG